MQICPDCGRGYDSSDGVCPHCGSAVDDLNAQNRDPEPEAGNEDERTFATQPEPAANGSGLASKRVKPPLPVIIGGAIALAVIIVVAVIVGRRASSRQLTDVSAVSETSAFAPDAQTTEADTVGTAENTLSEPGSSEAFAFPLGEGEILGVYNSATAKVLSDKASFSKRRETKVGDFQADIALKTLKDVLCSFVGIGTENVYTKTVEKNDVGYDRFYLQASSLTAADIIDTTGTRDADGNCSVTIWIRNGDSHTSGGSDDQYSAPLDKCGISVGQGDRDYWDHKTAQNLYAALSGISKDAVVDEKYYNAAVRASIDKDGRLTKLDVTFDIDVTMERVYEQSCHLTGSTTVSCSDFKW